MSGTVCACVCLTAPGSVEAAVGRAQERIFRDHGILSACALPPLVPVGFVAPDEGGAAELLAAVERAVEAPWIAVTGGVVWHEGSLFLSVDWGSTWDRARGALASVRPLVEPGPFPVACGFFMGCAEADPAARSSIAVTTAPLSFSSADIAFLRVTYERPFGSALSWETVAERPFRGRRHT